MSSDSSNAFQDADLIIKVDDVSKCYPIYERPQDRLKQSLYPLIQRRLGKEPKQYFREFWALRGVSFEVRRGETVGIIGRNGSGKSTLLQLVCETLSPTAGEVQTHGRIAALLELGSGFNPEFTGRENVHMNASLLGLTDAQIAERYDDIVAFADIGEFIDQPTKTYSSGMMVRLAFAVIAHVDADILVIDEALAVGDAFFTQKCMRFLRDFMKRGTILFVSHDTAAVRSLCNRAVWIDKGRLMMDGSPKDVCESYLEAFYASQQGNQTAQRVTNRPKAEVGLQRDQRDTFINHSNLRNDLEVFRFDEEAPSFGARGATITDVRFMDAEGHPLSWVVGGEPVTLRIDVATHADIFSPIIGFYIKDRHGQALFGDNTFLSYCDEPVSCDANGVITAEFSFQMPRLAPGDYAITVAVAAGSQVDHIQHHWIHDAIVFRSETSSVASGIIGIPMTRIQLSTESPE